MKTDGIRFQDGTLVSKNDFITNIELVGQNLVVLKNNQTNNVSLSGLSANQYISIMGKSVSSGTPITNQYLQYNGTNWISSTIVTMQQYTYSCSTATELNAALLAIHNSGKGGQIIITTDISIALTQNYNINNTYIMGGSNGVSMVKLTFTNSNYCYGTFYSLEGIGVDPFSTTNAPFKMIGQGFVKLSRIHHRGSGIEKTIDLGGGVGVYLWVDRCISLKVTNAASSTIYVYQNVDGIDAGGGSVISDDMSVITNALSITYKADTTKIPYTPLTSSHWVTTPTNVYMALNEIGSKFNSYSITASRPSTGLYIGKQHFDTTLNKPIWYNGSIWVDANGLTV